MKAVLFLHKSESSAYQSSSKANQRNSEEEKDQGELLYHLSLTCEQPELATSGILG
jgi:hypothetical protein